MHCRVCLKTSLRTVIDFGHHPRTKFLLERKDQLAEVFPIILSKCTVCGHIQLQNSIPANKLYGQQINLSSWKNQPHLDRIIELVSKLVTKKKKIVEIGCSDGHLLKLLSEKGYKSLVGVDPCATIGLENIEMLRGYFNSIIIRDLGKPELIICRHVLEHVDNLIEFCSCLASIGKYYIIEVPNFDFFMNATDYSGVWEEHCNYFTLRSLSNLLLRFGIKVRSSEVCNYSGQSLLITAEKTGSVSIENDSSPNQRIKEYGSFWPDIRNSWLRGFSKLKHNVFMYGAGCRGISLINYMGLGQFIDGVIDDQKEKQYKYVPGSTLPIYPLEPFKEMQTCLLAVNNENEETAINRLKYRSFNGIVKSILPPSTRMI